MEETIHSLCKYRLLFLLLFGISMAMPHITTAQDSRFSEFHAWTDLTTIYNFSGYFRYDGDYGVRGVLTGDNWTLAYARPSVRYEIQSWLLLHGGAALFHNFFKDDEDLPEIRPWAGLRFLWPQTRGFIFSHYFRLELRMFYLESDDEWSSVWRGRYQLQVRSPHFNIGAVKKIYLLTSFEIFEDLSSSLNDAFGDRFRYNIGIGNWITRNLTVELNYLFHKIAIGEHRDNFNLDDHVIRLRFFYNID